MSRKDSDLTNNSALVLLKGESSDKMSNEISDSIVLEKTKKKSSKKRKVSSDINEEILKVEGGRNIPVGKGRKERNSIILYKEHSKSKKSKIKNDEENQKNEEVINDNNNIVVNSNKSAKSPEKKGKNKTKRKESKSKEKRVLFMEPNFVTIIDVESYKQYNLENTSKDPYFDDVQEGKDNVKCTCAIF